MSSDGSRELVELLVALLPQDTHIEPIGLNPSTDRQAAKQ